MVVENCSNMVCTSVLHDVLNPVSPATFFAEYWGRKPLFIKGGADKLERLLPGGFGPSHFRQAVRDAEAARVRGFRLWLQHQKEANVYIQSEQIDAALASGCNVATELPRDLRVARLVAALKSDLQHPGDISFAATVSPVGRGWPLHVDASSNFSIQCHGRKRFVVSEEPVIPWPAGSISFSDDGIAERFLYKPLPSEEGMRVDTSRLMEFELEPGDVIYWPAGTLHTTEALSESAVTVHSIINHETFLNVFSRFLLSSFMNQPAWRHLPSTPLVDRVEGQVPGHVKDFFAQRLREVARFVDELSPDSLEFNREWHKLLAAPGELLLPYLLPGRAQQDTHTIERDDVLRLSKTMPLTFTFGTDANGERTFFLYFADKELSLSGEWFSFLQNLVQQDRFIAGSAMRWSANGRPYDWEIVQAYLQVMVDQGILER